MLDRRTEGGTFHRVRMDSISKLAMQFWQRRRRWAEHPCGQGDLLGVSPQSLGDLGSKRPRDCLHVPAYQDPLLPGAKPQT